MAPSTRKSKAVDKEAHSALEADGSHGGVLIVQLPEDLDSTNLSKLLTIDNITSLTPATVINIYRYILSQHHALEGALHQVATAQESLTIKDAEVEQAFQDLEVAQVETTEKFKSLQTEIDVLKQQNITLEQLRSDLQAQFDAFNSSQKQTSHDADELRAHLQEREREKRGLAETLEKVLATETRLQNENTDLRLQVQTQRKTLSEFQSQLAEAQASEANIKFKASTLEQQINLHEQSNEQLNVELSKQLARHAELRKSATEEGSRLQSQLDQKVSECDEVSERYRTLRNTHSNLDRKLHEILNKNRELQLEAAEASRTFQEEIQAYKHVLEQHERMSTENRARINEIEREETALRETLQNRETALITQAERERERSGALRTKVEELEGIIHRLQSGELPVPGTPGAPGTPGPDGSLILSPTASVVARLQRGGKSVTEVYADYVRIQRELQLERQEKNRLETTLNDIFNEIQDRAPILTQQRLEYERVTAEANQLATQLSQAIEARDIHARTAQEATHALEMKQKEIKLLEKQAVDMGRQINGLLAHVAHLEDPSLPDEYTDEPPTEGVLDSDAFISSNLVLFKNLRHLREQNQVLLKLGRKLGAQLEERERMVAQAEESEIMVEARQLIESLQKELLNASTKTESYVRERDMFKSMLGRSQNSLGYGTPTISLGPEALDYHKKYDEEHAMLEELRQKWNKELANLRGDIEKGRVDRDRLNQTINQLKSQVDFHKHVEQLAKDANAGQAQEIMALASRNRELQVHLRETESRISQVTGDIAEKSAKMDALASEVNLLKSEKTIMKSRENRLEHEHRTLVAERVRHNQTLEDYRKMKDELAIMWEQSKGALEAERAKLLSDLTISREELANERAITRARLTEKESEIKDISLRLTRTTNDLATTRQAHATAQTSESHLKIRVDGLTKQLQVAEERLAVFERKPGVAAGIPNMAISEEERLRAQVADLSAELKATQLELTTALSNSGMYQALAQSTEEALEAERKRVDEYSAKTEQELAAKSNELSTLRDTLSRIQLQLSEISQQRDALQTQLESREAEFAREKALLEDLLTDVQGADKRAQESQVAVQQELLSEAQRTREAHQKYQGLLIDHAAVLQERDSIQQELMEVKESIKKHEASSKVAQSILEGAHISWNTQSQALRQEVDEMRVRYDNLMEQNNLLHHQLGSVTRDAARLTEISESDVAALSQVPSSDSQVIELQQLILHMKRDVDLLRGQNDLLKRESARQLGKISQLTNELELTKQTLNEEQAEVAKASLAPSDRQVLLAKVEENSALIDSNRLLRDEKKTLEEKLIRKADDLSAATLKLEPLQQDLYNLRSEIDLLKTENTHLTNQVSTWRTRATTLTTKYDRIDPAEHQKVKDECAQLQKDIEERNRVLEETQQQSSELQGKLTSAEALVERARNAASTWKNHYENAKPRLAAMKERADGFEADLTTVQAELEASKTQNASLQQQLNALTIRAEALETQSLATRPSAPIAQPEIVDVTGLEAQISQLRTEKALLEAENNSLKELAAQPVAQAPADAQAQPGTELQAELNNLRQQNEGLTKNMRELAGKLNEVTQRNRHLMDAQNQLTVLEKKLADAETKATATGANPPGDIEAVVAQRTQEIQAQAVRERRAAVLHATAQLRQELEGLKKNTPNVQEMQAQHAAELDALRARLDQTAAAAGGDEAMAVQIAALKAQHEKDLDITRENVRKELEARAKMMQLQMTKLRQEITALKAAQVLPPAPASPAIPSPAKTAVSSVPPTPTDAAVPSAAVAPPIPLPSVSTPGAPRGRGVGRGTPGQRGGPVGRGRGRGTILDSVNQAMHNNQPPSPGELSILGAGQKRQREDETVEPGSLAKRLKPGEASLPAKPVPLNRNRPGAPGN